MKTQNNLSLITLVSSAILLLLTSLGAPAQTPSTVLELGKPVERQIKGGETHSYTLALRAGQFLNVAVEQKGIDVVVALFDPNNKQLAEVDSPNGTEGPEPLILIVESTGNHRLEIRSLEKDAPAGRYEAKITEMRAAEENDKNRIAAPKAAEALFAEGKELIEKGTAESLRVSVQKFEEARQLFQRLDNKRYESYCQALLGNTNNMLGEKQKALDYYNQALPLIRFLDEKENEATILNLIGVVYSNLGQNPKALEYFDQALTIYQTIKNKPGEIQALSNIAYCQRQLYEFAKVIEIYNKILLLQKEIGDKKGEAGTLSKLGFEYLTLGSEEKASTSFNQSLPLMRAVGDKGGEAVVLIGLGNLQSEFLIENQKAIDYYNQASVLLKAIGDKSGEGTILNNIGYAYSKMGERTKALEYYNLALPLSKTVGNKAAEARVLDNIGKIYYELNENTKALEFYDRALQLARETGFKEGEVWTLSNLMLVWNSLNRRSLSILYGKQSVNLYQQARSKIQPLDGDTQKQFLKYVEETYRHLADILISEGRFPEAQAVLDLLKSEEYRPLRRSGETADTIPYSQAEVDVITKIENLVALEQARTELQKLKSLSKEQEAKLEQLRLDIAAANKAFDVALDALGKAQASAAERVDEIRSGQEIQSALLSLRKETKSGVVALYTVLGAEGEKTAGQDPVGNNGQQDAGAPTKSKFGWVIMVTEKGYKAYPIDVTNLEESVFRFRSALSSDKYDPRPLAKKIYDAIFRQTSAKLKRTLEDDLRDYLRSNTDKTLMWSLDGVLRYIPKAALHDGKQYLVENYRNVVFTKQSFVWLTTANQTDWHALGLGVSEKREDFDALPGVRTELETIVREPNKQTGIMNGSIRLNDNFKKQMFFNTVGNGTFPVVHIASHYSFNPTHQDASFLLLGDGRLTFGELKENKNLFGTVDLLTLSACDTAVSGNGKEAEGFAYLAQSLGAKSVIASLWKVSDAGTPELMIRFTNLGRRTL